MTSVLVCAALLSLAAGEGTVDLQRRYSVGQELSYSGWRLQESFGDHGARFEARSEIDLTAIILDTNAAGVLDVGCVTRLRKAGAKANDPSLGAPRCDYLKVAPDGIATWSVNDARITLPIDGLGISELTFLMELPKEPIRIGQRFEQHPEGQPHIVGEAVGKEKILGQDTVKVELRQQSQNWESSKIQHPAWRSVVQLWVDGKDRLVRRAQRRLEIRTPASMEVAHRYTTDYRLTTSLKYYGSDLSNRREDFLSAHKGQLAMEQATGLEGVAKKRKIEEAKTTLQTAVSRRHMTPFTAMLEAMHEQAQSLGQPERAPTATRIGGEKMNPIGRPAANLTVHDVKANETLSLKKHRGQPVAIVFGSSQSTLFLEAVRMVQAAVTDAGVPAARCWVVITDVDPITMPKLHDIVPGTYTLCHGAAVDKAFGIDSHPHTLVIDPEGTVRVSAPGVGPELYSSIRQELERWANYQPQITNKKPNRTLR